MHRTTTVLRKIVDNPLAWIEVILSLPLLIFAIYLVSPLYHVVHTTSISLAFDTFSGRVILCIFYGIPAILTLLGVLLPAPRMALANKMRVWGSLLQCLGYLYLTTLRWITIGFFPVLWMFTLALSLIAAVLHLKLRRERSSNVG